MTVNVARVTSERMHDYYVAREAEVVQIEALSGGRTRGEDLDATHFYRQTGAADLGGKEPLTLKVWMQQTNPPAPSPDDLAAVRDGELLRAWQAHDAADVAADALKAAAEKRGAVFAELVAGDWSYGELAHKLGISRSAIHQAVKAHHNRAANARGDW